MMISPLVMMRDSIPYILGFLWSFVYKSIVWLAVVCTTIFLTICILVLSRISQAPKDIPWVGLQGRRYFPKLRACLGELTAGRGMIEEGYEKFGKRSLPFIVPGMNWPGIVLPPSNVSWLARQPESVLSGDKVLDETLGLDYLMHGPSSASCLDFTVIRRDLTRQTGKLTPQLLEEIEAAVAEEMADVLEKGDDWRDVKLSKVMTEVSFRTANRVFVGLPSCRSKKYRNAVTWWTGALGFSVLVLRWIVPSSGKGVVAPIFGVWTWLAEWWVVRQVAPDVKQRLRKFDAASVSGGEKDDVEVENDMTQWIINDNATKGNAKDMTPESIAGKMVLFNLFATGTTQLVLETLLFKMLAHNDAVDIFAELKEEADRLMPLALEDTRVVRDMVKLDSAIRETLRYFPLGGQGLFREVVQPGGVETPDGLFLPEGSHVQAVVSSMQQDVAIHGEVADTYEPLRYCRHAGHAADALEAKRMTAIHISEEYLAFGLGKHACPGRFFAVHVVKLIVGYMLTHFDFKPLTEDPKFTAIGEALVASSKNIVKMRRRQLHPYAAQ